MASVLIFFPYNQRTVEQQSVMEMLHDAGHEVTVLTSCERGYLHSFLEKKGITAEAVPESSNKVIFYFRNIRRLLGLIKKHKVDLVIAQQQTPALIAGIARLMKKFRLVYVRHNTDESYKIHPVRVKWLNKIVNALTPEKVAPSSVVKKFWIEIEGVKETQIARINYGYNFNQYEKPDLAEAKRIRDSAAAGTLVLSMARFIEAKRHKEMFEVVRRLVANKKDVKMICLGSGPMEEELKKTISEMKLEGHIIMPGRKNNIFDYIAASDVFMHLSVSEASNSSVKEVGLCKIPAIVCEGVGDFSDYIENGKNGFLVNADNPVEETYAAMNKVINNPLYAKILGEQFYKTITETFDINNVYAEYEWLISGKKSD